MWAVKGGSDWSFLAYRGSRNGQKGPPFITFKGKKGGWGGGIVGREWAPTYLLILALIQTLTILASVFCGAVKRGQTITAPQVKLNSTQGQTFALVYLRLI